MVMHGVLQRFDTDSRTSGEVNRLIGGDATYLAGQAPGFVSHRIHRLPNGVLLTVAAFDDEASARDWADRVATARDTGSGANLLANQITVGRIHDRKRSRVDPPRQCFRAAGIALGGGKGVS